ncbi:MAG: ATP synthase F0 subunit B [Deltaproteobacteria bacterium]|nr:ATP synthase F0 subunit B [Deltaproteobacteria bacterium]
MIDLFPNATFFVQWALFLIAFLTLRQAVFLPTLKILKARQEKTDGERQRADQLEGETEKMFLQIEAVLAQARTRGLKVKERQRGEATQHQAQVFRRVREAGQRHLQEVQKQVESRGHEVALQLRQYAQQLGRDLAEKVLERPL